MLHAECDAIVFLYAYQPNADSDHVWTTRQALCCGNIIDNYHYTKEIVCVCPDGRSPEVALTPRPWLAFRSTEKPGGVADSRAESA